MLGICGSLVSLRSAAAAATGSTAEAPAAARACLPEAAAASFDMEAEAAEPREEEEAAAALDWVVERSVPDGESTAEPAPPEAAADDFSVAAGGRGSRRRSHACL